MKFDDTRTIRSFIDYINTMNNGYFINKDLHIINAWLKLHTLSLIY